MTPLAETGERLVPEASGAHTLWEHLHRYRYATGFVAGRDVLDIACGEGYGSAALQKAGAKSVIGVDIDAAVCAHAAAKYGIDARVGDAARIPLDDGAVDVVVSFETIEHVPEPATFLAECRRVLRPGGRLVISTPNKAPYNALGAPAGNPFHCSELDETEFRGHLANGFEIESMLAQVPTAAKTWSRAALAMDPSPWDRVRGFTKLRQRVGIFDRAAEEDARRDPVGFILNRGRADWLNPFAVQAWPAAVQPLYLVAVAVRA
jgi:2-polyprenyl-3-methyl-5-hydroxy-6-metoxy-1,4-benzoquinol methylase